MSSLYACFARLGAKTRERESILVFAGSTESMKSFTRDAAGDAGKNAFGILRTKCDLPDGSARNIERAESVNSIMP